MKPILSFGVFQLSSRSAQNVRRVLGAGVLLMLMVFSAHASEPSLRHSLIMRGQVLEATADGIVVCVGESDGAQVGQVLEVVRHVRIRGNSPKKHGSTFRRQSVGQIEIQSLFDEHYARATVVSGTPAVNDVVELERK